MIRRFAAALGLIVVAGGAAAADEPSYADVKQILSARCGTCHTAESHQPGIYDAPAGVRYDTAAEIRYFAAGIQQRAVVDKSMPPGNVTGMSEAERQTLAAWYAAGAKTP